ncbi:MAG: ATP-binding protein [Pyrinomonadaceae bacterium]
MKLSKFDIGAEVISILTRGMYPDPRDAVREYIQNAVDAKSKNIEVQVSQNSVIVEDYGMGMDYATLRKALRLGISDKRPGKDVGFMGIGIYSAFHLCNTLTIYTRKRDNLPLKLEMNFEGMRNLLLNQKEKRLKNEITSDELIDLQTLLESYIELSDKNSLPASEYPVEKGTRVELIGLDPILDDLLKKFDDLASYLRDVVPLHFNKEKFKWAKTIENKISEICNENEAHFELVNLQLQVGSRIEKLYRPYEDSDFSDDAPREPEFKEIRKDKTFLGVAWGCLNSTRNRIANKELRGFLLKKQGFSIGKRENLAPFFGRSNTHFDRYIGEVVVVHPEILPNAARNDLEFSNLRTVFVAQLKEVVAQFYNRLSNNFQETTLALKIIEENGNKLKKSLTKFNPNEDNPDTLIDLIADLGEIQSNIKKKIKKISGDKVDKAKKDVETAEELEQSVKSRLAELIRKTKKRQQQRQNGSASKVQIAKRLSQYTADEITTKFDTLSELFDFLEIDLSEEMEEIISLIDEKFVQALSTSKADYYRLLNELKNDIYNLEIL